MVINKKKVFAYSNGKAYKINVLILYLTVVYLKSLFHGTATGPGIYICKLWYKNVMQSQLVWLEIHVTTVGAGSQCYWDELMLLKCELMLLKCEQMLLKCELMLLKCELMLLKYELRLLKCELMLFKYELMLFKWELILLECELMQLKSRSTQKPPQTLF